MYSKNECDQYLNKFICGDCMEYLPLFPDQYFDIVVVDPPYGLNEHGGKKRSSYKISGEKPPGLPGG